MTYPLSLMFPPQARSPITYLASAIDDSQDTILLGDASILLDPPNLITIGAGPDSETAIYWGVSGNTLTQVARGWDPEGSQKAWPSGTPVCRTISAHDIHMIQEAFNSAIFMGGLDAGFYGPGVGNVILGYEATGGATTTAYGPETNGDIAIGWKARTHIDMTQSGHENNIAIGREARAIGGGDDLVIVGSFSGSLSGTSRGIGIGTRVTIKGNNAIAIGTDSEVDGVDGIALGHGALSERVDSGEGNIAIGIGAKSVFGQNNLVIGNWSETLTGASTGIAIGGGVIIKAANALAIGSGAFVDKSAGIAIGRQADSTGLSSIVIGNEAVATGESAVAIGDGSSAAGDWSLGLGKGAELSGDYSIVLGMNSKDYGNSNCVIVGREAWCTGGISVVLGRYSGSGGLYNVAMGEAAYTGNSGAGSGDYHIAIGYEARTNKESASNFDNMVAIGKGAVATNANDFILGNLDNVVKIPGDLIVDGSLSFEGYEVQINGTDGAGIINFKTE